LHVQVDAAPHVLKDEVGLQLAAPGADWRNRPDMDPQFTSWSLPHSRQEKREPPLTAIV
jgi:hypothetical protein